ncbi:hypothetical protein C0995_012953 [Termitomyces sp. Mi166|nr:hypothetical protein C0995_012953 [Termitomyces sp. Mi166\
MIPDPATAEHFIYVTQVYFCALGSIYSFQSYWVITVVPYLLYCFVVDHPLATCKKIFRIPVALAMWNQVGSQSVLLIRTYAFFNRNVYILFFLIAALTWDLVYQGPNLILLIFLVCCPKILPSALLKSIQIAPLLFDTVVTAMTVWKAFTIRRHNGGPNSRLIQTFLREGIFYYILISIANLINGIFYLQPRQEISAINIPLSVMMGPVLACRLILDLRERGSETVSHSEGTGIAAFTTKSMTQQQGSPFTPPNRKSVTGYGRRNRGGHTISSNIMLSTLGSIHHDIDLEDLEQDLGDVDDIHHGMDMGLGSLSTAVGGDDGEPIPEGESLGTPAPAYEPLEMGFRGGGSELSIEESCHQGIKVEVERTTSTI